MLINPGKGPFSFYTRALSRLPLDTSPGAPFTPRAQSESLLLERSPPPHIHTLAILWDVFEVILSPHCHARPLLLLFLRPPHWEPLPHSASSKIPRTSTYRTSTYRLQIRPLSTGVTDDGKGGDPTLSLTTWRRSQPSSVTSVVPVLPP